MALTWDCAYVRNAHLLTTEFRKGIALTRIDRSTDPPTKIREEPPIEMAWHQHTEGIVWGMYRTGIEMITPENWKESYLKLHLYFHVDGMSFPKELIYMHIGMSIGSLSGIKHFKDYPDGDSLFSDLSDKVGDPDPEVIDEILKLRAAHLDEHGEEYPELEPYFDKDGELIPYTFETEDETDG